MLNEEILADLGKKLKQHRLNQHLTSKELAAKSGVSLRTVNAFEGGNQNIGLVNFIELLRALKLINKLAEVIPELPLITPIEMMEIEKKRKKRVRK